MTRLLACTLLILGASVCSTTGGAPEEWHAVYGNEEWYRERPEGEREWRGTLRPRAVIEGPNSRTALRYELGTIPVYAPNEALDRFASRDVTVRGKLVELEGQAELWVGAVRYWDK